MFSGTRTMTLAAEAFREHPDLRKSAEQASDLDELRAGSRRVTLDAPDAASLFVVEGDLIYDDDELRLYFVTPRDLYFAKPFGPPERAE